MKKLLLSFALVAISVGQAAAQQPFPQRQYQVPQFGPAIGPPPAQYPMAQPAQRFQYAAQPRQQMYQAPAQFNPAVAPVTPPVPGIYLPQLYQAPAQVQYPAPRQTHRVNQPNFMPPNVVIGGGYVAPQPGPNYQQWPPLNPNRVEITGDPAPGQPNIAPGGYGLPGASFPAQPAISPQGFFPPPMPGPY